MYSLIKSLKQCSKLMSSCSTSTRRLCTITLKATSKSKYTATVLLPQTQFPIRLSGKKRVERDDYLKEKCGFSVLYSWQRNNLPGPDFILHDGPPYANGVPHMGHAINKILKDITIRSKVLNGQRVHYVPGWDCHGLPIELKALQYSKHLKRNSVQTPLEIRQEARKFAAETIVKQRHIFKSWGVMADWKDTGCYFTNSIPYMTNQWQQFISLYEKNLIYRDFKPVYWSPSSRTALAEAELEYNENHKSDSIIIRLRVNQLSPALETFNNTSMYGLIWTTTPWTLVANQAVAFSADSKYCVVEDSYGNLYIVAERLLRNIEEKIGPLNIKSTIIGKELVGVTYKHPFTDKSLPFLPADHVTMDTGTGLVHTAPAHGPEDFLVALENNIPILVLVDGEGRYTEAAGHEFTGLEVLTEGTKKVLEQLASEIMHNEVYVHSYPYDWRTKKPVIIRASDQWFFDVNSIRDAAIEAITNICIYPKTNETAFTNALLAQVKHRPYWCISRQRVWGTPIPVLYFKDTGKPLVDRRCIERLCWLTERYGPDCWWELPVEKLIGQKILNDLGIRGEELIKGEDILDIWFDSGISWSSVLPEGTSDLYLEGSDQFNGWFQSSLLTSIGLQGHAPYRGLFVHGFAVNEKGCKMSKSTGDIVDPEIITKGGTDLKKNPVYGIDTLRWWVAAHGCQHSKVSVTQNLLSESADSVQKLRGMLRFLLGALHPYSRDTMIEPKYTYLDKYMLHCLHHYNKKVQELYNNYEYHHVCKRILNFVSNEVSAIYCHLVKDRLYCDEITSPYRIAALEVIDNVLTVLVRSIAPLLPHLAEEVWLYHPDNLASITLYRTEYTVPDIWEQADIAEIIEAALRVKTLLHEKTHENTLQLKAIINASKLDYSLLCVLHKEEHSTSELCNILQLSSIKLLMNEQFANTSIHLEPVETALCKRCRRYPETEEHELCERCDKIINNKTSVSAFP